MPVLPDNGPDPVTPQGGCTSWATVDDLCAPCIGDNVGSELTEAAANWLSAASYVVNNLTGRQFPGVCSRLIEPCLDMKQRDRGMQDAVPRPRKRSWWWNSEFGCRNCGSNCGPCSGYNEVALDAYPVVNILEIVVDGVVVPEDEYELVDRLVLRRLPNAQGHNPGWPTRQGDWTVEFEWGQEPPEMGILAVAVLACELAMSCNPKLAGKCRLPKSVTTVTREGVTMIMSPSDFLDKDGKTGLYELDFFIRAVNPQRSQRSGTVWSPGQARKHQTVQRRFGS